MSFRKLSTVVAREYFERVRSKWFIAATILGPLLMGLLMVLPAVMAQRERHLESGVIRVIDSTPDSVGATIVGVLRGGVMGDDTKAQYQYVSSPDSMAATLQQATQAVISGRLIGYLEVVPSSLERGTLHYAGRNTTSLLSMQALERSVTRAVLQKSLQRNGLDKDKSEAMSATQTHVETERLSSRGRGGSGTIGVIFALTIAMTLYLTIFIHGAAVMRGVLEEKQTRVAEVVLSSVPSDTLLMGKVLGIGGVGVTQLTTWVVIATGMMYARTPLLAKFGVEADKFSLPEMNLTMGVVILLTFLLGFLFYAALFAAVGAVVSTEQDAQQAQMPVVLLLVLTISTVQGILTNPDGTMAKVLTIIPFSSPIILPLRLSLTPIELGDEIVSLVLLALAAIAATLGASRLYRVGILMYGKRPSLREAWRWMRAA